MEEFYKLSDQKDICFHKNNFVALQSSKKYIKIRSVVYLKLFLNREFFLQVYTPIKYISNITGKTKKILEDVKSPRIPLMCVPVKQYCP